MGTGHRSKSTLHPFIECLKVFHFVEFLWCYTARIQSLSGVSGMKLLPKGSYFIEKFRKRLRPYVGIRVFDSEIGSLAACLAGLPRLLETKLRYRKTSVLTYLCINVNTSIGGQLGSGFEEGVCRRSLTGVPRSPLWTQTLCRLWSAGGTIMGYRPTRPRVQDHVAPLKAMTTGLQSLPSSFTILTPMSPGDFTIRNKP